MPFVLHVTTAERTDALAGALASVLRTPPADPMAPEWIVVVSAGMDRWLRLELSRHLGTSAPRARARPTVWPPTSPATVNVPVDPNAAQRIGATVDSSQAGW